MKDEINELVAHYYEKKKQGIDFSEIRKEMENQKIDPEKIAQVIRRVDDKLLKEFDKPVITKDYSKLRYAGYILMFIGGALTLANYVRWINLSGKYYWAFIPIIGGYLLVVLERQILKRKQKEIKQ